MRDYPVDLRDGESEDETPTSQREKTASKSHILPKTETARCFTL